MIVFVRDFIPMQATLGVLVAETCGLESSKIIINQLYSNL